MIMWFVRWTTSSPQVDGGTTAGDAPRTCGCLEACVISAGRSGSPNAAPPTGCFAGLCRDLETDAADRAGGSRDLCALDLALAQRAAREGGRNDTEEAAALLGPLAIVQGVAQLEPHCQAAMAVADGLYLASFFCMPCVFQRTNRERRHRIQDGQVKIWLGDFSFKRVLVFVAGVVLGEWGSRWSSGMVDNK